MNKIFITGATGFVGRNLTNELDKRGINYIAGNRQLYGDISTQESWAKIISGCDVIVHLAARVHVMDEHDKDPLSAFRKMNVEATVRLAQQAKMAGIKRFIYLSSIKVNGEETTEKPFSASDAPQPSDPYAISKYESETALLEMHEPSVFEITIIRPPLIYGVGVKANFEKLFWLVKKDLPIPFGKVFNKRSLVSVLNLCDLIICCFDHQKASGQIFLISDDHDYSLKELISLMGKVERKTPHLIPVPVRLMTFSASLIGKKDYARRLFGNLHVDISKTKELLNWKPKYDFFKTFSRN